MATRAGALSIFGMRVATFSPEAKAELAGLMRVGQVTTATSATEFASVDLIGQGDDAFPGWYVYVLQADNAAPEGEMKPVNDYVSSTGTVTHGDFAVANDLEVGDWVVLLRPEIAAIGKFDTSAATGAPTTTDELMAYIKQIVNNTYKLAEAADGSGTLPASVASDSLFAKLMGVGDPAVVTNYNNTTDSLQAQRENFDAVIGTLATSGAAGPVTTADLVMAYLKQVVTNTYRLGENACSDTSDKVDMTTEIVDNSILANILASDGDTSDYDRRRHSQMAIGNVLTPTLGQHFWVDQLAGHDTNNLGKSPEDPVLTIKQALTLCTGGRYDTIHIMANSPTSPPGSEDFPIDVDVAGVTIIGEHGKGQLTDSGIGSDTQDTACFSINANYVTIQDMYIGIANEGSNGGVIELAQSCFAFTLRHCLIEAQYTTTYGLLGSIYDLPYLLIEDCTFGSGQGAKATNWIKLANASMSSIIRRNVFLRSSGAAIYLDSGCRELSILDNRFKLNADTEGLAITMASGATETFVDGNSAAFGNAAPVNNPYLDDTGSDANDWGLNYAGGIAVMPATG